MVVGASMSLEARRGPATDAEDWSGLRTSIMRYVQARTRRADLAEDVTQETLARLVFLEQNQGIGSIFALAFRIADNLIVDARRREARQTQELDEELPSDEPSLERVVDSRRALDILWLCLQGMPTLRREVLIRRRLKQESCRAIAQDLSLSTKAVEKHITRGLFDLRRALEKAGIEGGGQ